MKASAVKPYLRTEKPKRQLPKEEDRKERVITVGWYETGTCAYCGQRDANRKTLVVNEDPARMRRGTPKPEEFKFICTECESVEVKKPKVKRKAVTSKSRGMHAEEDED